ncbi:MAG: hypothetical protein COU42_02860 [Candidatus Nealsonbacteria bacterium CG10_big_fil_rev_8_21_14_0_10_36_24]|uniref:HTH deoR-type domain-containing protein n=2 Tax=Candidatus Nealsoniibacteriota TaxID=1817911 RepID=A0A2H0YNY5_9BACT|nr:MAG: hypothetical protein COU42_02860 [Candidatus Nealsonbacteria bacterium CG10_big_fil_rev_8_21_14_0_10_36_24]PIS40136.1 MAG: hypothetical protein COT32_01365 [Candidatus Nealsonbacteria bacterium CG08_land_8_20_14_0_20_36_22]
MDKQKIIELTNKLYKQTLLFPKKEPLRYKMRETADNILAELTVWEISHSSNPRRLSIEKEFEVLKSYFNVAKWQNWVSFFDLLKIEEEYDKIKGELFFAETKAKPSGEQFSLEPRKKKILEILKEKEKIQVWEVKKILPNVSKRTLRRDFEFLLKQGIVERIGERNETFYKIKVGQSVLPQCPTLK